LKWSIELDSDLSGLSMFGDQALYVSTKGTRAEGNLNEQSVPPSIRAVSFKTGNLLKKYVVGVPVRKQIINNNIVYASSDNTLYSIK
jgi:hypothetical protein